MALESNSGRAWVRGDRVASYGSRATAALLFGLVLAVYSPTFQAGFVNWDDPLHVSENARVTEPGGLVRSWYDTESPGFYPVTYATFYLEWRASAGRPWLFHLDNVLLHGCNMLLVGLLAGRLGLAGPAAWAVAGLWALHPVGVASVAWVTERKNVLFVFFWLASLIFYLGWVDAREEEEQSPEAREGAAVAGGSGGKARRPAVLPFQQL